jgi:hypothetical protein
MYTTCLVHTLLSRKLPMLKGVNHMSKSEIKYSKIKNNLCMKKFSSRSISSYKFRIFFGIFKFWLWNIIYVYLLTWVGFGLIGYVPNMLYKSIKDLVAQFTISSFCVRLPLWHQRNWICHLLFSWQLQFSFVPLLYWIIRVLYH